MLTLDKIYHAKFVLKQVARKTDLIAATRLCPGTDLYLKTENLQVTGSFKVRGAYYKISQLSAEERAKGVIACSAGNHAQGVALAVEILQQVEGFDKYDKMIEGLTNVFEAAENAANSARKSAKEFAEKYKDAPVVYVMSSGASMEVAYSTSICLMMEMQWVNSGSFHSGEFFHGPFEIVDKDVPFILLMNDGKTRPVDARALTFLHRFDALTTVVDAKDYGLGNAVDSSVITYFNPLMHTAVFRVYAEELSYVRQHPLTLRRYMWKLEY